MTETSTSALLPAFGPDLSRWEVIRRAAALLMAVAFIAFVAPPVGAQSGDDIDPDAVIHEITFPVVGPVTYTDTWGACRGGGCSRSHKGVDIMSAKLAPLVAAADGTIISVRRSGLTNAGNKIVIRDDAGWEYYYFHLNNDSPGTDDGANTEGWIIPGRLRTGDRVVAGQVVGYLGDSGNAENTPNHLHFEIHQPGVGAINPTPSVLAAEQAGRVVPTSVLASTEAGRAVHEPLISAWYRALMKREPTGIELFAWADRFDIGMANRDDLIADLTMAPQRRGPSGSVIRAFQVSLGRRPTINELRAWEQENRSGLDAEGIVGGLLQGSEFTGRHGTPGDEQFIEIIYWNARGRRPAEAVIDYWLEQLATGRSRDSMAGYFVESQELRNAMWHDLEVVQAFRAALDRLPTGEEFDLWVGHLDRGGLIVDIVDGIKD